MGTRKTSALVHARGVLRWDYGKKLWQGRGRANKESHGRGKHAGKPHGERGLDYKGRVERPEKHSGEPGPFVGSRQHRSLAFRQRLIKGVGDHVEELGRKPFDEKREVVEVRVLLRVQMPRRHLLVEDRRR